MREMLFRGRSVTTAIPFTSMEKRFQPILRSIRLRSPAVVYSKSLNPMKKPCFSATTQAADSSPVATPASIVHSNPDVKGPRARCLRRARPASTWVYPEMHRWTSGRLGGRLALGVHDRDDAMEEGGTDEVAGESSGGDARGRAGGLFPRGPGRLLPPSARPPLGGRALTAVVAGGGEDMPVLLLRRRGDATSLLISSSVQPSSRLCSSMALSPFNCPSDALLPEPEGSEESCCTDKRVEGGGEVRRQGGDGGGGERGTGDEEPS